MTVSNLTKTIAVKNNIAISNNSFTLRHRQYGNQLYAYDHDLVGYDNDSNPVYMLESKHGRAATRKEGIDLGDHQFTGLLKSCKLMNIPLFCVLYYFPSVDMYDASKNQFGKTRKFFVIAANKQARQYAAFQSVMTEKQFVDLLYKIRKLPVPNNLLLDDSIDVVPPRPYVIPNADFHPKKDSINEDIQL